MKKYSWILLVLPLLMLGCKKEERDRDTAAALDHSLANAFFNDIFRVVDEAADETDGIRVLECVDSFTIDTIADPKSILIDFGDDSCQDQLGINRRGQILATFTGRYRDVGTVITITPINYKVDGYTLNGTKTITNEGLHALQQPGFSVEVENGSLTHPDGDFTLTWESSTTRTWVEGVETFFLVDDEYQVTGNAEGTDRNGNPYTINTQSPMEFNIVCPWIKKGKLRISPSGKPDRILDYGNGTCDNDAIITIGETDFNINL
ncbi:MAG: hypothetical protein HRT74_06440 [Flavobacteriales bacterium]|nr:hypothetical protein [Flavobacteriales bacterium]